MVQRNRLAVIALFLTLWSTALGLARAQDKNRDADIERLKWQRAGILRPLANSFARKVKGKATLLEISQLTRAAILAQLEVERDAKMRVLLRLQLCFELLELASDVTEQQRGFVLGEYLTADFEWRREEFDAQGLAEKQAGVLEQLLKKRSETFEKLAAELPAPYEAGKTDVTEMLYVLRAAQDAELALNAGAVERLAVLRKFQSRFEKAADSVGSRRKAGRANQVDLAQAKGALLTEQIELLREEIKQKADSGKQATIKKLLEERSEALKSAVGVAFGFYEGGVIDLTQALQIRRDALGARLEFADKAEERVRILQEFLKLSLLEVAEARRKAGKAQDHEVAAARAEVLALRIELLREEAKLPPAKDR